MLTDTEIMRQKSAMVLFAFERALGTFTLKSGESLEKLSPQTARGIEQRETKGSGATLNAEQLVAASYLDEIFTFALASSADVAEGEKVKQLKELCQLYDIFLIRNAIAHPNRLFSANYWYRAAALGSDPLIAALGLEGVSRSLVAAESGRMEMPSDDWVEKYAWELPNNLPDRLGHDVTGLLGRDREITDLQRMLKSPRNDFIAIVAPGGAGKTALALQVLVDLSKDPATSEWCDAILYISMKPESLGPEGKKLIHEHAATISALKTEIVQCASEVFELSESEFEPLVGRLEKTRIHLVLDNLDTLLRDSPELFLEFFEGLPRSWSVLATSRVTVELARLLTLGPLDRKAAKILAAKYARLTLGRSIDEDEQELLADRLDKNPLAIRLAIDTLGLGKSIDHAIQSTQSSVAEYSFSNLIDALSSSAIRILEVLYVLNFPTRADLMDILSLSEDAISNELRILNKTSLVFRSVREGTETYSLSGSVTDLIRTNPKNVSARLNVQKAIEKRKTVSDQVARTQKRLATKSTDLDYIDPDLPDVIKSCLADTYKVLKNKQADNFSDCLARVKRLAEQYDKEWILRFAEARVLQRINDRSGTIALLESAIGLSDKQFQPRYMLAQSLREAGRKPEALPYLRSLYEEVIANFDMYTHKVMWGIVLGYLSCLRDLAEIEELHAVSSQPAPLILSQIMGVYQAEVMKAKSETLPKAEVEERFSLLRDAMVKLCSVYQEDGHAGREMSFLSMKLCKDFLYVWEEGSKPKIETTREFCKSFEEIIPAIYESMISRHRPEIQSIRSQVEALIDIQKSVGDSGLEEWSSTVFLDTNQEDIAKYIEEGYVDTVVYHLPAADGQPRYLFTQDDGGSQYFVHFSSFLEQDWLRWCSIGIGSHVLVHDIEKPKASEDAFRVNKSILPD